jgi:hypothetical protein
MTFLSLVIVTVVPGAALPAMTSEPCGSTRTTSTPGPFAAGGGAGGGATLGGIASAVIFGALGAAGAALAGVVWGFTGVAGARATACGGAGSLAGPIRS